MPNWHGQNTGQLHDSITVAFIAQSGTGADDWAMLIAARAVTNTSTSLSTGPPLINGMLRFKSGSDNR
jgi:hypothetical protein